MPGTIRRRRQRCGCDAAAGLIGIGGAGDVGQGGLDVGDIVGHQQPFDVVHPLAIGGERQIPLQPQQFFAFGLTG